MQVVTGQPYAMDCLTGGGSGQQRPGGARDNSPAIYRWEQDAPLLLLLAGEAREQEEEGGTNSSDPPLKRWAMVVRPSGTIGLASSHGNCIRLNS